MKFIKNLPEINNSFKNLILEKFKIQDILEKIYQNNGVAYLVGGAIRDLILAQTTPNDVDIEVHGLELKELEDILKNFGGVIYVGKAYGVLKIHGIDIDWSIPRMDTSGRKPEVKLFSNIDIKTALQRRDLTINAIAYDIKNQQIIDPFNGIEDIENKVLRSPDVSFFSEDPLRFYRVMAFIGRFEMEPDKELNQVCATMNIKDISIERIELEFEKLFLKSKRPSLGIRWLKQIGRLKEVLPELYATIGVEQEYEWHPEGDVFEHSMQALDASADLDYENKKEKLICMYATLCHDLGKAKKTEFIDGRIRSRGHDVAGEPLCKKMLSRIMKTQDYIKAACLLVKNHMQPFMIKDSSLAAFKRLALRLEGFANLYMLSKVAIADRRGRNAESSLPLSGPDHDIEKFIERSKEAMVFMEVEKPILHGRDIMDLVSPGKLMGDLLKLAYDYQIESGIKDQEKLKEFVKAQLLPK